MDATVYINVAVSGFAIPKQAFVIVKLVSWDGIVTSLVLKAFTVSVVLKNVRVILT